MEAILLDTMFELPTLKGVEEVVIGPEVVEGRPSRCGSIPNGPGKKARRANSESDCQPFREGPVSDTCEAGRWSPFVRRVASSSRPGIYSQVPDIGS